MRGDNGRFAMTYTNRMLVGAAPSHLATPKDMANAGKIKGLLAKYGVPAPPE